jgi:hypothetical protein
MITEIELMSQLYPDLCKFSAKTKGEQIDVKFMSSARYRERYKAETSTLIPFVFKLILADVNLNNLCDISQTLKARSKLIRLYSSSQSDVITVIFGPTGDPMKLSGSSKGVWMFGHKLGHAIFDSGSIAIHHKKLKQNWCALRQIQDILLELYNIYFDANIKIYKDDLVGWSEMCAHISSFKSAQRFALVNNTEYICELVAEYVMNGKICFNSNSFAVDHKKDGIPVSSIITDLVHNSINNAKGLVLIDT